jgi:hypothetical protein
VTALADLSPLRCDFFLWHFAELAIRHQPSQALSDFFSRFVGHRADLDLVGFISSLE